jgi:hypothetical protein
MSSDVSASPTSPTTLTLDQNEARWKNALAELWREQSRWSQAADARKKARGRLHSPLLWVALAGVLISTFTPHIVGLLPSWQTSGGLNLWKVIVTILGSGMIATAAVITRELLGPKGERDWIKARAISEALKAEGYIFAASGPPYLDRKTAPKQLVDKIKEITAKGVELLPVPEPASDIGARHPHAALEIDDYMKRRLDGQMAWYLRRAKEAHASLRFWRRVAVGLAVATALIGVIAGALGTDSLNPLVAVVSTATATVATFVFANRYEFLAATYFATSEQLRILKRTWEFSDDHGEGGHARFILDCEGMLAAQNQSWVEELSKSVSDKLD